MALPVLWRVVGEILHLSLNGLNVLQDTDDVFGQGKCRSCFDCEAAGNAMNPRKRKYVPKIKGCHQCSKRRINCDQDRPSCQKCIIKGLQCSGFGFRYKFVDEKGARWRLDGGPKTNQHSIQQENSESRDWDDRTALDQLILIPGPSARAEAQLPSEQTTRFASAASCTSINCGAVTFSPRAAPEHLPSETEAIQPDRSIPSPSPSLQHLDELEPWKQFLLGHFSTRIASEMVVMDDDHNGWRHLILPLARADDLVMDSVLCASAFHFSVNFDNQLANPNEFYMKTIHKLRQRQHLNLEDQTEVQTTFVALLVLLVTVIVNGNPDFPAIFGMIESALTAIGGEDQLPKGELGVFILRQIRKLRGYAAPLLSQAQGVQTLQHDSNGWDCFRSYFDLYPKHVVSMMLIYKAMRQANDIYLARVSAGSEGEVSPELVTRFKNTLKSFKPDSLGEHTLVWATFIAAAESSEPEDQLFFSQALLQHYRRNGFANILRALEQLKLLQTRQQGKDWTQLLPRLGVFIV